MIKRNIHRFDCNLLFNTNTYSIQNDKGKLKHSTLSSQTNRLKIFLVFQQREGNDLCHSNDTKKQKQLIDWCKIWISFYFNLPGEEISFTPLLFIYNDNKIQNTSLHHHFQWLKTATVFCISTSNCICHLLISSWITKKPLS